LTGGLGGDFLTSFMPSPFTGTAWVRCLTGCGMLDMLELTLPTDI
jgi:hypothetical protein